MKEEDTYLLGVIDGASAERSRILKVLEENRYGETTRIEKFYTMGWVAHLIEENK